MQQGRCVMNNYIFFWLITALGFLMFELGSPGLFYFLSFSCGALITSFAGAMCATIFDQAIIFIVSSIASFFALTKWVGKTSRSTHIRTNVHALIGKKGVVVTPANIYSQLGYVHVSGQVWAYKALNDHSFSAGSPVEIVDVRGAHVVVRPSIHSPKQ